MKRNKLLALFLTLTMAFLVACSQPADKKDSAEQAESSKANNVTTDKETSTDTENNQTEAVEKSADKKPITPVEGTPTVTATTTFVSDMVKRLAGDWVNIQLIIPAGEDPHMYEPKPQDLEKLTSSDLVIYHGLHFEGRMVDVLEKLGYQLAEGFPADKVGTMDQDGDIIIDPHFWFDVDLYKRAVENVANYLSELLPDHKDAIQENLAAYQQELDKMLTECKAKMDEIPKESRYLITPHDAFNYFSRCFDIPVMAPQGVSTDSEVANKDIQNTVDFIVKNKVKAVFAETTTDPARMEKLKEGAAAQGFEVKVVQGEGNELFSDSLAPEGSKGDNFIDMFTHNVNLIVDNLK